jgi:hypothetical protein
MSIRLPISATHPRPLRAYFSTPQVRTPAAYYSPILREYPEVNPVMIRSRISPELIDTDRMRTDTTPNIVPALSMVHVLVLFSAPHPEMDEIERS